MFRSVAVVLLLVLGSQAIAAADEVPVPAAVAPPVVVEPPVESKYDSFLASEHRRATWWNWTWGTVFFANLVVASVQLAVEDNPDKRIDHEVSIARGVLAVGSSIFTPLRIPSSGGRAAVLLAGEEERDGRGIFCHLKSIGVSTAALLFLGIGYGHWKEGLISAGTGILVSEIKIFTQPYRAARITKTWVVPDVAPDKVGLVFGFEF